MKHALIMEGGAMRGLFTCGVMDVLMEEGIVFEGGAGISAGAVFGVNYKSRQAGRPLRYNLAFCKDPRYGTVRSVLKTGDLFDADFCYRAIPDELDIFDRNAFKENPMEFYIGATDVETGKAVYHLCTDGGSTDTDWMRASASMPLVSRPVEIEGHCYLDGGIADSVPYRFMESRGYEKNVIILTQPADYRKKISTAMPLLRLFMKQYPAIIDAMAVRHTVYNHQIEETRKRESEGRAFVICPPAPLPVSRMTHDPAKLQETYNIGREEMQKHISSLKEFLNN